MTDIADTLAQALRAVLPFAERDAGELYKLARDDASEDEAMAVNADVERAAETLAAYDACQPVEPIPDPLTVAYIAMGALTPFAADSWNQIYEVGQSEYIAECIQHAAMLDSLAHLIEPTGSANFYYEFAEPFGGIYGIQLLAGENPDAQAIASAIIKELQDAN